MRPRADTGSGELPAELPTVSLPCERRVLDAFRPLLQEGVATPARTGVSILAFLTEELGIDPGEIADRVKTVFLDGQVVDALDRTLLRDGSVLALSAAMPGLVGATLRRGGFYAAMRADITRRLEAPVTAEAARGGTVRLKLFNLLIDELGPRVLARGVVLEAAAARALVPREARGALAAAGERVLLRVSSPPEVQPCA